MSTWFAVTTMLAIWASFTDWVPAAAEPTSRNAVTVAAEILTRTLLEFDVRSIRTSDSMHVGTRMFPGENFEDTRDDPIATGTGKPEHVAGGDVQISSQRFAQQCPRPEESRPDGGGRDAERIRGLLNRHFFHFSKREHGAEGNRQLVDTVLEHPPDLGSQGGGRR